MEPLNDKENTQIGPYFLKKKQAVDLQTISLTMNTDNSVVESHQNGATVYMTSVKRFDSKQTALVSVVKRHNELFEKQEYNAVSGKSFLNADK